MVARDDNVDAGDSNAVKILFYVHNRKYYVVVRGYIPLAPLKAGAGRCISPSR